MHFRTALSLGVHPKPATKDPLKVCEATAVEPQSVPRLQTVLAEALKLSCEDATVARHELPPASKLAAVLGSNAFSIVKVTRAAAGA